MLRSASILLISAVTLSAGLACNGPHRDVYGLDVGAASAEAPAPIPLGTYVASNGGDPAAAPVTLTLLPALRFVRTLADGTTQTGTYDDYSGVAYAGAVHGDREVVHMLTFTCDDGTILDGYSVDVSTFVEQGAGVPPHTSVVLAMLRQEPGDVDIDPAHGVQASLSQTLN